MKPASHAKVRHCAALLCALALLASAGNPARAQPPLTDGGIIPAPLQDAGGAARPLQDGGLSLQQAVEIAMRRFDGRVVRAETQQIDGRRVHVIRILDANGRVRNVRIDAQSGRIR